MKRKKTTLLPLNHPDLLCDAPDPSTACDTICPGIFLHWRHLHGPNNRHGLVVLVVAMERECLFAHLK